MLRYTISREDYDREAEPKYPISTPQVVIEMRARGIDMNLNALNHVLKKDMVGNPPRPGAHYEWAASDVDRFIDFFEAEGWLTPHAQAAYYLNLNPAELKKMLTRAGSMSNLAWISFTLGAPGVDMYGQLSFRAMTPEEIATQQTAIIKADSERGERNAAR